MRTLAHVKLISNPELSLLGERGGAVFECDGVYGSLYLLIAVYLYSQM